MSESKNGVRLQSTAFAQLQSLGEKEREGVVRALRTLVGVPPEQWPSRKVRPLETAKGEYLLRAPKGYRAVIKPAAGNEIEVLYVLHEEFIRTLQGTRDDRRRME
jgi:hypothetical protein